jgi:hypothetical protein
MNLDAYSRRAEAFNSELAREYYLHFAGLNGGIDQGAAYQRHATLFDARSIDALRAMANTGDGERARRAAALLRFAVEGSVGSTTFTLDAELARREATLSVQVPAGASARGVDRLGLGEMLTALAAEPDPERRAELDLARRHALEEVLQPLASEALAQRHAHARRLGWDSYADLCAELAGVDLAELDRQAQAFLDRTQAGYARALESPARDVLDVRPSELRRCDLPRLLRNPSADRAFPADRLLPVMSATLDGLGLDLEQNMVLDVEPRTRKSARAFCVPVRIPQEIYLVLQPVGGRADYRALLHETGHAQHFAGADPALPFELRRLGDPAVGEAFAFLLEGLVDEPAWQRRHIGGLVNPAPGAHARAQRLLLLRRYAAKLSYERELHAAPGTPDSSLAGTYARRLSDALQVQWPPESWLTDVDPGMYVVSYLRGWALERALRSALTARFGELWFEQREAGDLLRALWHNGQRMRAEELAELLDPASRLDFSALAEEYAA